MSKKDEELEVKAAAEPDFSTELTEDEKLKLVAEARREVAKEIKASKRDAFKEAAKRRIQAEGAFSKAKDDIGDDVVEVDLVLASHPKFIILDGKVYHSGKKHKVRPAIASVLLDQMDRGWRQEEARLGDKTEFTDHRQKILGRNGLRLQ